MRWWNNESDFMPMTIYGLEIIANWGKALCNNDVDENYVAPTINEVKKAAHVKLESRKSTKLLSHFKQEKGYAFQWKSMLLSEKFVCIIDHAYVCLSSQNGLPAPPLLSKWQTTNCQQSATTKVVKKALCTGGALQQFPLHAKLHTYQLRIQIVHSGRALNCTWNVTN